ncbi:MAG: DnaJ domain-containing protein [Cytophagaceae bacterium]|nr:DnaJ domain-containing protein [Cytophagaceae bacterium]
MPDYYQLLGLARTASQAEVRAAYRRLALRWHPDKNPGDGAAEEFFKQLNEAHQVLSDSVRRYQYDQLLFYAEQSAALPAHPPRRATERRAPPGYQPPPPPPAYRWPDRAERLRWGVWMAGFCLFIAALVWAKGSMDRSHAEAEWREAHRLLALGDTTEAVLQLTEVIFHQPQRAEAYRLRGEIRLHFYGREELAYQDFRKALSLSAAQDDVDLRQKLGICCVKQGRLSEALVHFNRAVVLAPENGRNYLLRGAAFFQLNDKISACADWLRAWELAESQAQTLINDYCP